MRGKLNTEYHLIKKTPAEEKIYFESFKCKVCGSHRGSGDHRKCSRTLQKLRKEGKI